MKTLKTAFIFGLLLVAISCKKEHLLNEKKLNADKDQILYGVYYGSHIRNYMDIALPKNRTKQTPVVIFIHGGAWIMGSKEIFYSEIKKFADAGIACATINYRYASDITNQHHADLVGDIRKAVDFIASKSNEYEISDSKFGLVGQSAGGHLALITAYTMNADSKIKACASWAGPVNLIDKRQQDITGSDFVFKTYVGCELNNAADTIKYKEASPYWMATNSSVPTLLIHGTDDIGVPYSNIADFKIKLDNLNVANKFVTFQGGAHLWAGENLKAAREETLNWFFSKL